MEIGIELTIKMPKETAKDLGITEDSVIEAFYEDGFLHIRTIDPEILMALEQTECEGCEFYCPACNRCTAED